jgi:hypothetical protein
MKIDTSSIFQISLKNDHSHTNHFHTDMKIVDMQINDTLILIDANFTIEKEKTIINAKIMIKSRDYLDSNSSLKFNDTIIER